MKIRKLFKKAAALALAAVTALSVMPAQVAFAAGDIGTISFRDCDGYIIWSVITQSHREICLCIGINQQHLRALFCQTYTEIDRCGRFSDTAFLVCQSNHFAI